MKRWQLGVLWGLSCSVGGILVGLLVSVYIRLDSGTWPDGPPLGVPYTVALSLVVGQFYGWIIMADWTPWFDEVDDLMREHRLLCWKDQDPLAHHAWLHRNDLVPGMYWLNRHDLIVHPAVADKAFAAVADAMHTLPVERGGYVDKGYLTMLGAPTVVVSEYAVTRRGGPEPPAWVKA